MYAAFSMSVIITYRGSGVVNLAVGALAMIPAMVFAELRRSGDLVLPLVILPRRYSFGEPLGFVPAAAWGSPSGWSSRRSIYLVVIRSLRTAPPVTMLVATVGVDAGASGARREELRQCHAAGSSHPSRQIVIRLGGRPFPVDRSVAPRDGVRAGCRRRDRVPGDPFRHRDTSGVLEREGCDPARSRAGTTRSLQLGVRVDARRLCRHHRLVARRCQPVQLQPLRRPGPGGRLGRTPEVDPCRGGGRRGDRQLRGDRCAHRGAAPGAALLPRRHQHAGAVHRHRRRADHRRQASSRTGPRSSNAAQVPVAISNVRTRGCGSVTIEHRSLVLASNDPTIRFAATADPVRDHAAAVDRIDSPVWSARCRCAQLSLARFSALHAVAVRHDAWASRSLRSRGRRDGRRRDPRQHSGPTCTRCAVRHRDVLAGRRLRRPTVPESDTSSGVAGSPRSNRRSSAVSSSASSVTVSSRRSDSALRCSLDPSICAAIVLGVRRGAIGRRFLAVRANERAAAAVRDQRRAHEGARELGLASFIAGIAGVMFGYKATTLQRWGPERAGRAATARARLPRRSRLDRRSGRRWAVLAPSGSVRGRDPRRWFVDRPVPAHWTSASSSWR